VVLTSKSSQELFGCGYKTRLLTVRRFIFKEQLSKTGFFKTD